MTDTAISRRGRPPKDYTSEIMDKIVERVSVGETLRAICKEPNMPSECTFRKWVRENPSLAKAWHLAKELRAHSLFDKAIDLADILSKGNGTDLTANQIRALQVAIDTYKFAASRLNPRDYGERVPISPVVPVQIVTTLNLGQEGPLRLAAKEDIYRLVPTKIIEAQGD